MNTRLIIIVSVGVLATGVAAGLLLFGKNAPGTPVDPSAVNSPSESPLIASPTPDPALAGKEVQVKDIGENASRYEGLTVIVPGRIVEVEGKLNLQDAGGYLLTLDTSQFRANINDFKTGQVRVRGKVVIERGTDDPLRLQVEFVQR